MTLESLTAALALHGLTVAEVDAWRASLPYHLKPYYTRPPCADLTDEQRALLAPALALGTPHRTDLDRHRAVAAWQKDLRADHCETCREPILWGTTKAGKGMPLNPGLRTGMETIGLDLRALPTGYVQELLFLPGQGAAVKVITAPLMSDCEQVSGYISHFATCKQASQHRRRRE